MLAGVVFSVLLFLPHLQLCVKKYSRTSLRVWMTISSQCARDFPSFRSESPMSVPGKLELGVEGLFAVPFFSCNRFSPLLRVTEFVILRNSFRLWFHRLHARSSWGFLTLSVEAAIWLFRSPRLVRSRWGSCRSACKRVQTLPYLQLADTCSLYQSVNYSG